MKRKRFLKRSQIIKITSNRREYSILTTIDQDPYNDMCCLCPMYDHCKKYKHNKCRPERERERNWKSQSKKQKQWI
jgi:hypothetical protein